MPVSWMARSSVSGAETMCWIGRSAVARGLAHSSGQAIGSACIACLHTAVKSRSCPTVTVIGNAWSRVSTGGRLMRLPSSCEARPWAWLPRLSVVPLPPS